jgi:outer membrane PBP1 activator LpoA protein
VADGAEFVIGPLLPGSVTELANDILVPVPVLTLNYLPDDTLAPPGLYQFALAPEDEARSVAARAIAEGHSRAVARMPSSFSWPLTLRPVDCSSHSSNSITRVT